MSRASEYVSLGEVARRHNEALSHKDEEWHAAQIELARAKAKFFKELSWAVLIVAASVPILIAAIFRQATT